MSETEVTQLGPNDTAELSAFLARDPVQNLYLLGLLEEFGIVPKPEHAPFAFYGRRVNGALSAAVFVGGDGGLVVPSASDFAEVSALGKHLAGRVRLRNSLGDQSAVDTLVRYLTSSRPRLAKAQRLYRVSADELGPFTNPALRLARESDLDNLVPLAAQALVETVERDPLKGDAQGFRERVRRRVAAGRTYVLEVGGKLVFKIEVGSRSAFGAELEGLYTTPEERRKGHATLSLGQVCRHLLSSMPRLTLRVDEAVPSLAGVAKKVGFVAGRSQRLVVNES